MIISTVNHKAGTNKSTDALNSDQSYNFYRAPCFSCRIKLAIDRILDKFCLLIHTFMEYGRIDSIQGIQTKIQ